MNIATITNSLGFSAFWLVVQLCRLLPFKALYLISDIFYVITYYFIPLRRHVALENLQNAFPNLSATEIKTIYKKHVHFICDLTLETLKGFTLSGEDMAKRWKVLNPEIVKQFQQQSILIVSSHYANWEWGACLNQQINCACVNLYKPLRNSLINNYILKARKNINATLLSVKDASRYFLSHRREPQAYILLADQHPGGANQVHWLKFLYQETAFMVGPAKYAQSFNYPVVYAEINYVKRGYYEITFHVITDQPKIMPESEITEKSMRILEQQICANPPYWLWGHKRWKLKRTVPTSSNPV